MLDAGLGSLEHIPNKFVKIIRTDNRLLNAYITVLFFETLISMTGTAAAMNDGHRRRNQ
jgi:hypothetical protein